MSKLRLPVIVSMGGINAAGRSSGHHAYRRMVFDKLDSSLQYGTLSSLASMCGLEQAASFSAEQQQDVLSRTLIRRVEQNHFDVENLSWMTPLDTHDRAGKAMEFECRRKQLPRDLPPNWVVQDLADDRVSVRMEGQG
ncbi:MAG: beta-ketoacyl synthase, partial [Cellvibrionaceae bacterium]|nr:beta-ketoacyl synthase [Cellvibrionaceae bacterium]